MSRWTLQGLIDERMKVHAYCHNPRCHHNARLDLQALRDRLGPDASGMSFDLAPKLKCARCGGKQIGLIYGPDTTPASPNPYLKAKGG